MEVTIDRVLRECIYQGMLVGRLHEISGKIAQELQNETQVLTCIYCGHQYPPGTPRSNHKALTEHIAECSKHPMKPMRDALVRIMNWDFNLLGDPIADAQRLAAHALGKEDFPPPPLDVECRCDKDSWTDEQGKRTHHPWCPKKGPL